jgi:hypothetical protein
MVLVILLTNVLIRKREMMKVTQKVDKHIKIKELQRKFSRKKFCTKEDISSSYEDEVSDSETRRVLFMAVEDSEEEYEEAYEEEIEEAKVDFREELMSAIEVIRRENKKNKKLQTELDKKKDTQKLE